MRVCDNPTMSNVKSIFKVLPWVFVMASVLFLSGCAKYAMKKDLVDLQQKVQETDQDIYIKLSRIEQAPKADSAELADLKERLNNISMYALELERRIHLQPEPQLQPQMTLGVKTVSIEDVSGLVRKINELDSRIKSVNVTKNVALNSVSFPLGKVRVEDLSRGELSKLKENALRIREERPPTVEIVTWADGRGTPDTKEKVAGERARNVELYYKEIAGEGAKIKFQTVFKVASASGPFWRRADTTMWLPQKLE